MLYPLLTRLSRAGNVLGEVLKEKTEKYLKKPDMSPEQLSAIKIHEKVYPPGRVILGFYVRMTMGLLVSDAQGCVAFYALDFVCTTVTPHRFFPFQ